MTIWNVTAVVHANVEAETAEAAEASLVADVARLTDLYVGPGSAVRLTEPFEAEDGTEADWIVTS